MCVEGDHCFSQGASRCLFAHLFGKYVGRTDDRAEGCLDAVSPAGGFLVCQDIESGRLKQRAVVTDWVNSEDGKPSCLGWVGFETDQPETASWPQDPGELCQASSLVGCVLERLDAYHRICRAAGQPGLLETALLKARPTVKPCSRGTLAGGGQPDQ